MEALVLHQEIEPLPIRKFEPEIFRNEGLLSSTYKLEISHSFFHSSPRSIFGIKQKIRNRRLQFTSAIETILKLSVFAIGIAIALI